MKILAFAATNNSNSINAQLVRYTTRLMRNQITDTNIEVEFLDLNDYELPIFSEDRERDLIQNHQGHPELAHDFFNKITESDAVVISFAEHNGSYTAAYKNIFDWASRINQKVFQNKPMIMLSTSPGPGGASSVLASAVASAPFFAGDVKASLSIPSFYENFDTDKQQLINEDINNNLMETIGRLFDIDSQEIKQAV